MVNRTTRRSRFLAVIAVLALGVMPAIAGAAVLLNETFSYPDGNLVGNDGWTAHSGAGAKMIQVTSGQAVLAQSTGSGEDVNAPFAAQGAADKTYVSFDVTIPAGSVVGAGDYFAHPRNSATFIYPARIFNGPPLAGGDFTFGIRASSSSTIMYWPSDFSFDSTHKLVVAYDAATGDAQLWIDPAVEASPSVIGTGGAVGDLIDSFALRQASPSGTTSRQLIDNLLVGDTFSDVVPGATAVQAATWGRVKNAYK